MESNEPLDPAEESARRRDYRHTLLIGTLKGAFFLRGTADRSRWDMTGPFMLGTIIDHIVADPRDDRTLLIGARTGHMGPTVYRSQDGGHTWQEAEKPPAFAEVDGKPPARAVESVFWLTPGHPEQAGVWYAGTIPFGLFRSRDGGKTWAEVEGFNRQPELAKWAEFPPPGGPYTHSILVDPRDAKHLYVSLSVAGFFESVDAGATWSPINKGCAADFSPEPDPEVGQDPHCTVMHPANPDRFYQQNHCGIYRMDRADAKWVRIGDNMPREIGDIGFPIATHPRDPDTVWVFPMDGTEVWPRTSPGGRPAVYRSRDAGQTWERLDEGLPEKHAYLTVFRHCLKTDEADPVGVYFGTTSGEVWGSFDEGERWQCLASHLPKITSIEVVPRDVRRDGERARHAAAQAKFEEDGDKHSSDAALVAKVHAVGG